MENLVIRVDNNYSKSVIAVNYLREHGYSFISCRHTFLLQLRKESYYLYIVGCYDGKIRYSYHRPKSIGPYKDITSNAIFNKATIF